MNSAEGNISGNISQNHHLIVPVCYINKLISYEENSNNEEAENAIMDIIWENKKFDILFPQRPSQKYSYIDSPENIANLNRSQTDAHFAIHVHYNDKNHIKCSHEYSTPTPTHTPTHTPTRVPYYSIIGSVDYVNMRKSSSAVIIKADDETRALLASYAYSPNINDIIYNASKSPVTVHFDEQKLNTIIIKLTIVISLIKKILNNDKDAATLTHKFKALAPQYIFAKHSGL